jgi:hypothetical protein
MRKRILSILTACGLIAMALAAIPGAGFAASHREAPLISQDPTADITDFFMFRSYEQGKADNVVLIMDVIPGEEPSSGPNYYNFDPNVLYKFELDNDQDGKADDVSFEVSFENEFRGTNKDLDLFLSYVAVPPITALDGPGSEGLGWRQKYTVTMIKDGKRRTIAKNLIAVPSNVGPRTMPDYGALAQQGIYSLDNGVRAFAGQRDDPFYIDLGAVFDTLNLRQPGVDMLSGFNVHTIALEIPASLLTDDGKSPSATKQPVLGAYASTSRRKTQVLRDDDSAFRNGGQRGSGSWVQVQRLANPLVNEVIIGTRSKDRWNATDPNDEKQFLDYYRNPRFATALNVVFGAPVPATPRDDLVGILLKYGPNDKRFSELLRLNLGVEPKALADQKRLTVLDGDNAGWPNGRRPIDDVTDVAVQVVGGPSFAGAGDNVSVNDKPLPEQFPFLASPWDGRGRVHIKP